MLDYGGGAGKTWSGFWQTDQMEDMQVRDRYSNVARYFNPDMSAVSNMNIEHIWANSWWGHLKNNAYCDLFNLYPADRDANGRKSNNPIGIITGNIVFDNGMTRVGISDSYRSDSLITAWEPADEWKGDFARTYFYMATTYQHMTDEWQTNDGLLTVDPKSWQTMRPWVYHLMLEWAEDDPVDDIERERNELICQIQGNRNPYVDWPELADYVWGKRVGETFYLDPEAETPELFVPVEGQTIDFGLQSLQLGLNRSLTVRGRNFPDGLTATLEGEGFTMADANLSADEVTAGTQLVLTNSATEAGNYEATLILSSGDYYQHVPLCMTLMDGIPAYPARDITCTQYSKKFTASWMDMHLTEGEKYTVNVYSIKKDVQTPLSGFPKEVEETTLVVDKGLAASTTYYYQVTAADGTLVSNTVQVDMPALTPEFKTSSSYLMFSAMPDMPSTPQQVTLSAKYMPQAKSDVTMTCTAPFEFSVDGENWECEGLIILPKASAEATFFVRLGEVPREGNYEGELELSAPGVNDIVIDLTAVVDYDRGFFESFELSSKSTYAVADLQCVEALWRLNDVIIYSDNRRNDNLSARLKVGGSAEMLEDKPLGCDSLWFWAGLYNNDTGVKLTVSYSLDQGSSWTPVVNELAFTKGEWNRYGYRLDVANPLRLRFEATGTSGKRINLDDIQMSHSSNLVVPVAPMEWMSEATAPSLVYTLDGRYVGNVLPSRRGIYLVRRGSHLTKKSVR